MVRLIVSDLQAAWRGLSRTPGFTVLALVTMALCIGANTAIYSVIDAVVIRPLPFPEPDRLVRVRPAASLTARMIAGIERDASSYVALAGATSTGITLTGSGEPEYLRATLAGTRILDVFGAAAALGRGLRPADAVPGSEPVAIISHELWLRRFDGDSSVLGTSVALAGEDRPSRTVVGILPAGYRPFPWVSDVLLPMAIAPGTHDYSDMARYTLFGRLRSGVSAGEAAGELRTVLGRLAVGSERGYISEDEARQATVIREHAWRVHDVERSLWVLLASVAAVLLIGCVNVANLLLTRGTGRTHELAVRHALGAGTGGIVRFLLIESAILGLGGGLLGYGAAVAGVPALVRLLPPSLPRLDTISVSTNVVVFAIVVSAAATVAFGLVPAIRFGRSASRSLREAGRGLSPGRSRLRLNRALVTTEVATAVTLAAAAGLFAKSLTLLNRIDPGFDPLGLHAMTVTLAPDRFPDERARQQFVRDVELATAGVAGVSHAGAIQVLPLSGGSMGVGISPDGAPVADNARPLFVSYRIVTPGYMEALRVPLRDGRQLRDTDRADAPPVGLVNESMARLMWPGEESVVGTQVRWDNGEVWFTVVGVVSDIHQHELSRAASAEAYVPFAQDGWATTMYLLVRGDRSALDAARAAIWRIDPHVPLTGLTSMEQVVDRSLATARFHATLIGSFALLAVVLAAIGVYGVTSYMVSQRTRELGIRLALGATGRDLVWWLIRAGATPVAVGGAIGIAAAVLGAGVLSSLLFGVTPTDPAVLVGVGLLLLGVASTALAVPAMRAYRVDAVRSLAGE